MRFQDLLDEKYYETIEVFKEPVEIFVQPSPQEIRNIIRNSQFNSARFGIEDKANPKLYVWDGAQAIHRRVLDKKIKFDFGFYYEMRFPEEQIRHDRSPEGTKDWEQLKNKKAIIKRIKKSLPKASKLLSFEREKDRLILVDLKTGKTIK